MANKTPKNDFAPAWLKIPSADSSKPHSNRSSEQGDSKLGRSARRDDYYYNRYPGPPPPDYPYQALQRQRSFDNYYDDRRYPPQKFRHHSVEDEYYNPQYGGYPPYYNNYDYDKYGNNYRSQPSLYRDSKYQHPNARYNHMNGGYPPYYDSYYDYYGDPYYPGYMNRPPPGSKRLYQGDRERHPSKSEREKNADTKAKDTNGEEDFPSLNGDDTSEKAKVQNTSGVWEKQAGSKLLNNGHVTVSSTDGKNTDAKGSTNMYKALIPQKGSFKKLHGQVGGSPIKVGSSKLNGSLADHSSGSANSTSAPVEILNSQLKSPPKKIGDKKSEFLRQIKGAENGVNGVGQNGLHENSENGDEARLCNGVKGLSVSPMEEMLSSSLEAEERLLREMGWNEADDEEYVITEDDKKEFQSLSKQLKEKKNGLTRILPKTWSPTHLPVFPTPVLELNDSLSSSDDDSDADLS